MVFLDPTVQWFHNRFVPGLVVGYFLGSELAGHAVLGIRHLWAGVQVILVAQSLGAKCHFACHCNHVYFTGSQRKYLNNKPCTAHRFLECPLDLSVLAAH